MKTLPNEQFKPAQLTSYYDLQSELVRALYDGEGLDGLTVLLADRMNGCTVVRDLNGSPLSIACSCKVDGERQEFIRKLVNKQSSQPRRNAGAVRETKKVPTVSTDEFNGDALYQLETPLEFCGKRAGLLTVIRSGASFSAEENQAFTYAAGLFSVQMAQDKKVADIELRLKGNFVEDLISSHYTDPDSILSRARALDYNINAAHRVLVAEIENLEQIIHHLSNDQKAAAGFKTDLVQAMQSRLNMTHRGMVVYSKDTLILLVQQNKSAGDIDDFKALAEKIIEDAASQFKAKVYIGIGSACTELADFSKSYLAAKKSLEIGEYMITEGQVRSFEQFKIHALFLSTLKPAELYNYAREQLEALLTYDALHQTDFLKTLQEFLYLRNNVEGTAKTLNMSVSGLKYRLQKIEKIIGLDLKDYKVCFDLQLALVIMQLFGEYRIKEKQ